MDIEPIATTHPWKTSAFVSEYASSISAGISAGEAKPLSPRASLRRFKAETSPPPRLEMRAEFLRLEEEADAAYAKDFQGNGWQDEYNRHEYFQKIAYKYAEAGSLALEDSRFMDAARLLEKEALVYVEKIDRSGRAIQCLLKAWKLYSQNNCSENAAAVLERLHKLVDLEIASSRQELLEDDDFALGSLTHWLANKAEIFELTGSPKEAEPLYEEIGNLCLELNKEGTAYGHLHPLLIAGLAFEKLPDGQDKAKKAYEDFLSEVEPWVEIFPKPTDRWEKYLCLVFSFPVHLQISLASLKCGNLDVFTAALQKEIDLSLAIFEDLYLSLFEDLDLSLFDLDSLDTSLFDLRPAGNDVLSDYIKALVSTALTLLGPDSPHAATLTEAMKAHPFLENFAMESPSDARKHFEAALIGLYLAPKEMSVKEIAHMLEDRQLFPGP